VEEGIVSEEGEGAGGAGLNYSPGGK